MLSGISFTCFAASYTVSLALEVSRLFFRAPIRWFITFGFAAAGLFAQTVYLWMRAEKAADVAPLSSWYDWCLLGAWLLVATYLVVAIRRPQAAVGVFLLPLVMALLGVAWLFEKSPPFPREQAKDIWGQLHGLSLLGGTVVVMLGFAAGIMYLVQSYRLKHKLPPRPGFQLPSLELLQRVNRFALYVSSGLLALGLLSGIVLNLLKTSSQSGAVPWTDPVVISSGALLLWLVASSLFEFAYRPAREGRKVAYLTVASFVFLAAVLAFVLFGSSRHAGGKTAAYAGGRRVFFGPGTHSSHEPSAEKDSRPLFRDLFRDAAPHVSSKGSGVYISPATRLWQSSVSRGEIRLADPSRKELA